MKGQYLKRVSKIPILFVLLALLISVAHPIKAASPPARLEIAELKIGVPDLDPSFLPNWAAEQRGF